MILMLIVFEVVFVFILVKIQKHYNNKIDKMFKDHEKWMNDFHLGA